MVVQDACAWPEAAILCPGGALAPAEELRDTILCAPEEEPGPCTAVSGPLLPSFCISSLD